MEDGRREDGRREGGIKAIRAKKTVKARLK